MSVLAVAPRREAVLFLPHMRQILLALFRSEGWAFRDESTLRYRTMLDGALAPDEVAIEVLMEGVVKARILGRWQPFVLHVMIFRMEELVVQDWHNPVRSLLSVPVATCTPIIVGEYQPPAEVTGPPQREQRVIQL